MQSILGELLQRAGIAADVVAYKSVNPFIKAPGAVHPKTGRVIAYDVVGDSQLYTLDDFAMHFSGYTPWRLITAAKDPYPDDPVVAKRRRISDASRAAYRQYRGPSYAFLADLSALLHHWSNDLSGRSNAFFRSFAWHRRSVLLSEVGAEAGSNREQLDEKEFTRRVYDKLRIEMEELNERTGRPIDKAKMNAYLNAKFPPKPQSTGAWASALGVDRTLARELGLKTILPEDERRDRTEAADRKRSKRRTERQLREKALDEMIMSGEPYDFSIYSEEQVKYRRKRLIEAGEPVPKRSRGRRKKGEGSPVDTPPPNR